MQNVDLTIDNGAKNIPKNVVASKDGSGKRQIRILWLIPGYSRRSVNVCTETGWRLYN